MIKGLEIEQLGGMVPVQAEGRIGGLPFYFRARHDGWSLSVAATPEGNALEARFGHEPGWFHDEDWSCARLGDDPGRVTWVGDESQIYAYPECDHIHCAGYMPNLVARDLIATTAARLLAGEPSADWSEPGVVTATRLLEAGLADGSLHIREQNMGWYTLVGVVPTEPAGETEPK